MIVVGLCGCTNAYNVFLIGTAIQALCNTPLAYASSADATTCHSVFCSTNIALLLKNMSLCVVCLLGDKNLQFYCVLLGGQDILRPYPYEVTYH